MGNSRSKILGIVIVMARMTSLAQGQASAPAPSPAPNPYSTHSSPPKREKLHYEVGWGVDALSVKWVESGELIRFSYRVLDPSKAAVLNDEKIEPYLIGERARVKLVIPSLEKVGQLRNRNTPEAGKSYWMAFSNKGRYVKKGDRVTVVIGKFRADGLIVQ